MGTLLGAKRNLAAGNFNAAPQAPLISVVPREREKQSSRKSRAILIFFLPPPA